jgi:hypothetical protein
MTDDVRVSMHASIEDDDIPVMYDDEPRNPREVLKHKESADILQAGALEMKQMRDRGVAVEPHPDELDRIKREHKILRAKLVYKRKYMAGKARLAIVGTAETEGVELLSCPPISRGEQSTANFRPMPVRMPTRL